MDGGKSIVFFGDYNPSLRRCQNLEEGFGECGYSVRHCRVEKRNLGKRRMLRQLIFGGVGLLVRLVSGGLYREKVFLVPEGRLQFFPLLLVLKKLFGARIIIDVYDFIFHKMESRIRFRLFNSFIFAAARGFERFCFRNSDLLLVESDGCKEVMENGLAVKTKVLVWPVWSYRGGSGVAAEDEEAASGEGTFSVVYWGNFHFHHGVSTVLRAADIIGRRDPSVVFYLVGDDRGGKVERYRQEAAHLGLKNCRFTGRLSDEALNALIARSGACLGIFSRHEKAMISITNKVFESMSAGRVTLTARSAVSGRYFRDMDNIVLVEPDSPEDLAEKILIVKNDRTLRETIEKRAVAFFRSDYNPGGKAAESLRLLGIETQ